MLTPIKKQGDEHIYILLQIGIINWISVRYVDIMRFVWMLIGSVITYGDALSILYEVHVKGNHADGDKVLQKKSCHEITPAAAKARSAQVLRNSPRTMPLSSSWSQDTLNPLSTLKNKLFPKLTYCWLHTTSDLRQILSFPSNKTSLERTPKATFSNNAFSFSEHG